MPEPTYKLCPRCGEPIETEIYGLHVRNCDGSGWTAQYREEPQCREEENESIADRAERLADRDLYPDGTERGRR